MAGFLVDRGSRVEGHVIGDRAIGHASIVELHLALLLVPRNRTFHRVLSYLYFYENIASIVYSLLILSHSLPHPFDCGR